MGQDRLELSANGLRERPEPAPADAESQIRLDCVASDGTSVHENSASGPVYGPILASEGRGADPVEIALAAALERASAAGQWDAVLALAAEIKARRARLHIHS